MLVIMHHFFNTRNDVKNNFQVFEADIQSSHGKCFEKLSENGKLVENADLMIAILEDYPGISM